MNLWAPVAIGMVAGVAVSIDLGWPWEASWGLACLALACRIFVGSGSWRGARTPLSVVVGLGLGMAVVHTQPEGPRLRGQVAGVGLVRGAPMGRMADVAVGRWRAMDGSWQASSGGVVRVRLPFRGVAPGDRVVFFGQASALEHDVLPGAPDPIRAARLARVRTFVYAHTARVIGATREPDDREIHGLLRALATGDRRDVEPEWTEVLRGTGTAHLLAISGFHVGTVAAVAWGLARALAGVIAVWRPAGVPTAWVRLPPVLAAVAFATAVGWPVSAQRAVFLVALVALKATVGRPLSPLSGLGLAAAAVVIVDPASVAGPSFQLSFGAVWGLVTWGQASWASAKGLPSPVRRIVEGAWVSIAATIGTLPASAWWFQAVAPLSPLANLAAMPWTALVLAPCAFGAVHLPGAAGVWAAWLGQHAADGMLTGLSWLVVPPWRPAVGPMGALLLCGLFVMASRPWFAAAWTLCVLGLRPVPVDRTVVTFPNVGQASAALVAFPDGRRWLVDGGRRWPGVDAWLRRQGVTHLDRVYLSHEDDDHAGGLVAVVDTMSVGELHVAGPMPEELEEAASRWGVMVIDDPNRRLHPRDPAQWRRPNDRSLVLSVPLGGLDLLLPGDIERGAEQVLAPRLSPHAVVALPHHGSPTSSTDAFLDAVRPGLAIAQAGRNNRFGHPDPDVLTRLAQRGVRVLRSDVLGTIRLSVRGDRVDLEAWRAGWGWRRLRPWSRPDPEALARASGGTVENDPDRWP